MITIYVIENQKSKWYIGITNHLERRLSEHNTDQSYTTKRLGGPWELIYTETCLNEIDGKKRERFLKTTRGRAFLQKRLRYYLKK
jgi:putative endonuclease